MGGYMERRSFLKNVLVGGPTLVVGLNLSGQTSLDNCSGLVKDPNRPSAGLFRSVSNAEIQPVEKPTPLPPTYLSPDADLKLMAAWALRHLIHNPRPALNYEPVFY